MSKRRTQIRQAVVRLLQGKVGATVWDSRVSPFDFDSELPVVNVLTQTEEVEKLNEAPRSYRYNLFLHIEVITKNEIESIAVAEADLIGEKIMQALAQNDDLGFVPLSGNQQCLADDTWPIGMDQDMEENGSQPVVHQRYTFHVKYNVEVGKQFSTDFNQANVDWSINNDINTTEATDQIEV